MQYDNLAPSARECKHLLCWQLIM